MNRQQLLEKLGVSAEQLQELLQKFHGFLNSLDEKQRALVQHSFPSIDQAVHAFGPDVDANELKKLFESDTGAVRSPVILFLPAQHYKSRK